MKSVAIINTWFQMITVINMLSSSMIQGELDLIITDQTESLYNSYEKILNIDQVRQVYCVETKKYTKAGTLKRLCYLIQGIDCKHFAEKSLRLLPNFYDAVYFNNFDFINESIYRYLKGLNKELVCFRFEEGYGNYLVYNDKIKSEKILRFLSATHIIKDLLLSDVHKFFVYNRQYICYSVNKSIQLSEIPLLDNIKRSEVEKIFPINKIIDFYNVGYIIFEDCFYTDGWKHIGDMDIYKNIKNLVGTNNIVGKLHPRSTENRFKQIQISTQEGCGYPWEVVELYRKEIGTTYITVASGSALAPLLYFHKKARIIFLYRLFDEVIKSLPSGFENFIKLLCQLYGDDVIFVPQTEGELYEYLKNAMEMGNV